MGLKIYEVTPRYVDYIVPLAPHLFQNKQPGQHNERKYVGIILTINGFNYFAPLSSYKPKHKRMQESLDFIKLGDMAVININNMFPVPDGHFYYVNISTIKDAQYKKLLLNEYRIIRTIQNKITKNAAEVYRHKLKNGNTTKLSKRCNDFSLLEQACKNYKNNT